MSNTTKDYEIVTFTLEGLGDRVYFNKTSPKQIITAPRNQMRERAVAYANLFNCNLVKASWGDDECTYYLSDGVCIDD